MDQWLRFDRSKQTFSSPRRDMIADLEDWSHFL